MGKKDLKLVLIGETGIGKSQLGNFILQKKAFDVGDNNDSKTDSISERIAKIEDMSVTIVDTPGLNDTKAIDFDIMELIIKKFQNDNAIDGIILVYSFKKPRKTQKDQELIKNLITIFGIDILKIRLKVIITNRSTGEEFEYEKHKIETQTNDTIQMLDKMVDKEDIIFVNTADIPSYRKMFYPEIKKLIEQFYEIKEKNDSMNNALIKKKELEIIEKKKKELEEERKKKEEENKRLEEEKRRTEERNRQLEEEKRRTEERNRQLEEERKKKEEENKRIEERNRQLEEERKNELIRIKQELEKQREDEKTRLEEKKKRSQKEMDELEYDIRNLTDKIYESEKEISRIEGLIKTDKNCAGVSNAFLLFTLGFSAFGTAHCLNSLKKHEEDLRIEKQRLNDLKNEKSRKEGQLELIKRNLLFS